MSQSIRDQKAQCAICGQLFHEPLMGAFRNYDFRRTRLSDEHIAMFHSANRKDRSYDDNYLAAHHRLEQARQRRADALWRERTEHEEVEYDTPGPQIYPFRAKIDQDAKEVPPRAD